MPACIFHAHHWSFRRIADQLDDLAAGGFDAIQISPAQKSPAGSEWYLRYQPVDHLLIEGLGSWQDLEYLCARAREWQVMIVADVVFNHMAVLADAKRDVWLAADLARQQGNPEHMQRLRQKLGKAFPHLSAEDFAPWRDMHGADWDNAHRYESWGNGEWAELLPTDNVKSLHQRHLRILYDAGVRGFRFDAVKHMRPQHLADYVAYIRSFAEPCWVYGEVFSDQVAMHQEYSHLFATTDFAFVRHLRDLLKSDAFVVDPQKCFLDQRSVRFGVNHDLAYNPPHLVDGFLFSNRMHSRLANCLSVLLEGGVALVLADEYLQDAVLRSCIQRRAAGETLRGLVRVSREDGKWLLAAENRSLSLDLT